MKQNSYAKNYFFISFCWYIALSVVAFKIYNPFGNILTFTCPLLNCVFINLPDASYTDTLPIFS